MKRILIVSVLLLSTYMVFSQLIPVKWYTIEEAEKLNQQQPKKFMIDVYTDWCGWCKKMDKETFANPFISQYLNEHFYPVKFDAEQSNPIAFGGKSFSNANTGARSTHEFAQLLLNGQMSYPSIAFITERLELLGAVPGYKDPKGMEAWLVYVKEEHFKTRKFDEFMLSFKGRIQ